MHRRILIGYLRAKVEGEIKRQLILLQPRPKLVRDATGNASRIYEGRNAKLCQVTENQADCQ